MNGSRSSSGSRCTCGPSTIVARNSRGVLGFARRRLQPALAPRRSRPPAGARSVIARRGVVPRRLPAGEVLARRARARPPRLRLRAQAVDVALSPALRHQLPARAQRARAARANRRSWSAIQWKVAVERIASTRLRAASQLEQVHRRARRPRGPEPLARRRDHRRRLRRRAITRPRGRRSSSASVMRPEPQPASSTSSSPLSCRRSSTARPERLHRCRRCGHSSLRPTRVPARDLLRARLRTLYAITYCRIQRAAASPARFESCPPCQAIGERGGGPASSTTSARPGDRRGVALADRQRMARVGLVAAGDHDASARAIARQLVHAPRTGASGAPLRARRRPPRDARAPPGAGAGPSRCVARQRLGHARRGRRRARTPPRHPRASPRASASQRGELRVGLRARSGSKAGVISASAATRSGCVEREAQRRCARPSRRRPAPRAPAPAASSTASRSSARCS